MTVAMPPLEPLSNTVTATDLATLLFQRIFSEHGFPEQIISDQDTLFTSNVWKALFALTGTRLTMSYSYHQRFDGQTEVMNRVIEEIMRCYLNYNQDNWVDLLPHITCAVNNAPNPKTGISANEIFYGRRPKMPVDLATRSRSCTNETAASIAQRIAYLNLRAQEASRLAISSLHGQAQRVAPQTLRPPPSGRRPRHGHHQLLHSPRRQGPPQPQIYSKTSRPLRNPPTTVRRELRGPPSD